MPALVAFSAVVAAAGVSVQTAARRCPENTLVTKDWATCAGVSPTWAVRLGDDHRVCRPTKTSTPATPTTAVVASAPLIRIHLRVFCSTVYFPPGTVLSPVGD